MTISSRSKSKLLRESLEFTWSLVTLGTGTYSDGGF